jgi:PST family polysaccharide transporter
MLGSARGVGIIVVLVRLKVLSYFLGRAGMGTWGLVRGFLDPLTQILPLGVNAGVVKFVAQYRKEGDEPALRGTVSTAAWFFLAISSAAMLVILIFSRSLAVTVLHSSLYRHLIVLAALSLPLTILAGFFNALLVGAERIKAIVAIHYLGHAVTLSISIPLIVLFKLTGAVVSLVLLEAFYCTAYGLTAARHVPLGLWSFQAQRIFRLAGYGAATLGNMGLWMLVFLIARVDFQGRFGRMVDGQFENELQGLFEIAYRLSFQYVSVLLFALNTYVYPRMSGFKSDGEVAGELNTALRGLWLLLIPIVVMLSILIKPLIWLFSNAGFYAGAAFLPWQLVGDVFYLSGAVMGLALLGRGRLGAYLMFGLVRNATFLATYAMIQWLAGRVLLNFFPTIPESLRAHSGWQGLVWAHAAGSLIAAVVALLLLKRLYGFRLTRDNQWLIGLSSLVMLPVLFVPNLGPVWVGAKISALAIWGLVVVRRSEWRKGLEWIDQLRARK